MVDHGWSVRLSTDPVLRFSATTLEHALQEYAMATTPEQIIPKAIVVCAEDSFVGQLIYTLISSVASLPTYSSDGYKSACVSYYVRHDKSCTICLITSSPPGCFSFHASSRSTVFSLITILLPAAMRPSISRRVKRWVVAIVARGRRRGGRVRMDEFDV